MKAFALAILTGAANAWWDTAHLLTARRAYDILEETNKDVLNQANEMLEPLKVHRSDLTNKEKSYPFVECAVFADNIKGQGFSWQSEWHFINTPYVDEDGKTVKDFPKFTWPDGEDIVEALDNLVKFVKDEGTSYKSSTYCQQIASSFDTVQDQKSFALRLIIHYVGDLHQPLHAAALVDTKYPKGDAGGNYEHIPSDHGVSNLHSVWDSVVYEYTQRQSLPASESTWNYWGNEVDKMVPTYKVDDSNMYSRNYPQWQNESLEAAEKYAYDPFVEGQEPNDAYKAAAVPIARGRIMFGGARLADLMVQIFSDSNSVFLQ